MKNVNENKQKQLKTSFNLCIATIVISFLAIVVAILGLGFLFEWFGPKDEGFVVFLGGALGVIAVAMLIAIGVISLIKIDYYGKIKGKTVGIVLLTTSGLLILGCVIAFLIEEFLIRGEWEDILIYTVSIVCAILLATICFLIYLLVQMKKIKKS